MSAYTGPLPPGPTGIFVSNDTAFNVDKTQPDGQNTFWPMPRFAQYDVAEVIKAGFANFGITSAQIPVFTAGTFHESQLRTEDGKLNERPVIVVSLAGDSASRVGVNSSVGEFNNATLADNAGIEAGMSTWEGEFSDVSVEVDVFCANEERANQVYMAVKLIMQAAAKPIFMGQFGYTKPMLRTSGSSGTIELGPSSKGGQLIIFQRSLTYAGQSPDFIGAIVPYITLLQEQMTLEGNAGDVTAPPVDI